MSYLHNITIIKDIEAAATFDIDLLEVVSNHVESLNDLKEVVECVHCYISEELKDELRDEGRANAQVDLIDQVCSAKPGEVFDALHSILSQHPKAFHQFISSKHSDIKLSMMECSQALITELEEFI
ncbi:hypothetical protein L9W80_00015 [Vibrio aestuarianus]|uniref:hypothetical protein n=1 Tax=Vibrio aestuarianus TaxID=28171 RepID=UPI00237CD841|nr:hypothetical protein [Vibrio aestuarianus]MDE1348526.1 hypothetical protein [Vibrio aestuarianus]